MLVAVDVVNDFPFCKRTTQRGLHHHDVLADVPVVVGARMLWLQHKAIAVFYDERLSSRRSVAGERTKPRTIVPTRTDRNRRSTVGARPCRTLSLAGERAIVFRACRQLAVRSMEGSATSSALNVGKKRCASSRANSGELRSRCVSWLIVTPYAVVARFVTEHSPQSKSRWWKVNRAPATVATADHVVYSTPPLGGRWRVKDLGHFEFPIVAPGGAHA